MPYGPRGELEADRVMLRRELALALATALVLVQIVGAWHLATTPHHWCAAHHAIEDGAPAARAGAPRAAPHQVTGAESRAGDHERCVLTSACVPAPARARHLPSPIPHRPAEPLVASAEVPPPSRSLLRIAPKTSPPVA